MPCRDAAAWLAEAAASLAAQSFADFECIIVDDGSSDATPDIIAAWSARDRRVRAIRTTPRGIVPALQTAYTLATGELLARMDADDVAYPERFARQVALLDAEESLAGCGTQVRYFPDANVRDGARRYEQWINALLRPGDIVRDLFVECPIPHPTLMLRRSAFEQAGGYRDVGWPEDYDLLLRLWAAGCGLGKVGEVLLDWRESELRLSRRDERYAVSAFQACKVHHLARTLLREREGVVVWGAGPVGKGFARHFAAAGMQVRAFVELDARKIGQTIHGAPVIDPTEIHRFRGAFAVAAVAGDEARAEIRSALDNAGWIELKDYCAVA